MLDTVSGEIVPNAWTNGPDQPECAPPPPPECDENGENCVITLPRPKPVTPDYYYGGWAPEPIIVCDEISADFALTVGISLRWNAWNDDSIVNSKNITILPNNPDPSAQIIPFSLNIPTNVLNTKPNTWSSLSIVFKTYLSNGTEFGFKSTESLTLAERDQVIIQSDKAKYKPGNLVNFRFLFMDINLKPILFEKMNYVIESPSGNKMSQKQGMTHL